LNQPTTSLEAEIAAVLESSGLASEKDIQRGEQLALNKLDEEEVHIISHMHKHQDVIR
jgi:U3 small nucleolar RNA-associated protein 14